MPRTQRKKSDRDRLGGAGNVYSVWQGEGELFKLVQQINLKILY